MGNADNVVVVATLENALASLSYVSSNSDNYGAGTYNAGNGTITWNIGSITM